MPRLLSCLLLGLTLFVPASIMAHDGPHGGELFCDSKHSHHAELCIDKSTGKATVYILDKKAKNELGIAAKTILVTVKGIEKPVEFAATATKEGKSSQFVLKHDRFTGKLKPSEVKMEIVLVPGKPAVVFNPEHEDD